MHSCLSYCFYTVIHLWRNALMPSDSWLRENTASNIKADIFDIHKLWVRFLCYRSWASYFIWFPRLKMLPLTRFAWLIALGSDRLVQHWLMRENSRPEHTLSPKFPFTAPNTLLLLSSSMPGAPETPSKPLARFSSSSVTVRTREELGV